MEGFTSIELMIALATVAAMAMIGINAFQQYLAKAKLRLVAQQIVADFTYYGNKAKSEGRLYSILFNSASPSYTISAPAAGMLGAVKVVRTLSDGITCTAIKDVDSGGCKSVRLTKQGLLVHYDVSLSLQNNADKNFLLGAGSYKKNT